MFTTELTGKLKNKTKTLGLKDKDENKLAGLQKDGNLI